MNSWKRDRGTKLAKAASVLFFLIFQSEFLMLPKLLLSCLALFMTSQALAHTLDLGVNVRRSSVNDVDWKGVEYGFSYLFDINDALSVGPYLTSTSWDITNDAMHTNATGDHREFGPEIRFFAPMETLNFLAGASYSLVSKGTAETDAGMTADLSVVGLRFKIGLGIPFDSGVDMNVFFIKGVQAVVVEDQTDKATETLDDLAFGMSLSF